MEQKRSRKQTVLRTILVIIAILALLAIAWCVWYIVQYYKGAQLGQALQEIGITTDTPVIDVAAEPEYVDLPVDFDALREINSDIYAWVEIPGTAISYPVLHRAGNDAFYSNHSSDSAYYSGGSIYSEDANRTDFTDPVTLLYGHNLRNGTMFAQLNDFADVAVFDAHPQIYVYTPEKLYIYDIFFAGPHSNEHLLANHDFSDQTEFETFFTELGESRSLSSQMRADLFPEYGEDRVLVLSTCFRGNNRQRFLVQGRLLAELPVQFTAQ